MRHGAWGMGLGAWGLGHGAWGMEHGGESKKEGTAHYWLESIVFLRCFKNSIPMGFVKGIFHGCGCVVGVVIGVVLLIWLILAL